MSEPILDVRNLTVAFPTINGPVTVVRNVSFALASGETLALIGESGSGKSVTASALLQIIDRPGRIVAGSLLLRVGNSSIDIAKLDSDSPQMRAIRAQRISMVFQEPMSALSPVHRCGRQVLEKLFLAEPSVSRRDARSRLIQLFEMVELPTPDKLIDRYPFELSGGQRQRIVIAMAIAGSPDILIADEPTTALDVTTQASILELLSRLQRELNMSMLFVTHDMSIVAKLADRLIVMRNGAVVEAGPKKQLFDAPVHPYTSELLSATRRLDAPAPGRPVDVMSSETVLDVKRIGKTFMQKRSWLSRAEPVVALRDVSFALCRGESLGIVGESGSGKSTLLRCLLGLTRPTSGTAVYYNDEGRHINIGDGLSRTADPTYLDLRMIFQDPWSSLDPRMSILDAVSEPLHLLRKDLDSTDVRELAARALVRVGIDASMLDRFPHAFSGGQRQRIVIARAIVTDPRVIFADEATAALDVSLRAQVLDLLLGIQRECGMAFLFVTHDISSVRYFCNRVIVMRDGQVVESGGVDEVLERPKTPYTQSLIRSVCRPFPVLQCSSDQSINGAMQPHA